MAKQSVTFFTVFHVIKILNISTTLTKTSAVVLLLAAVEMDMLFNSLLKSIELSNIPIQFLRLRDDFMFLLSVAPVADPDGIETRQSQQAAAYSATQKDAGNENPHFRFFFI